MIQVRLGEGSSDQGFKSGVRCQVGIRITEGVCDSVIYVLPLVNTSGPLIFLLLLLPPCVFYPVNHHWTVLSNVVFKLLPLSHAEMTKLWTVLKALNGTELYNILAILYRLNVVTTIDDLKLNKSKIIPVFSELCFVCYFLFRRRVYYL